MNRRHFFRTAALGTAGLALAPSVLGASSARLVILHTNDTHSRIEPFEGGRSDGLGGVARRAALIASIREREPNVLLLDSGDIFQGTPYFNLFNGEIDFKAMSAMRYDVATLGNHDFDNGVGGLADMMPFADFEFVSANYTVAGTPLAERVRPYTVRQVGGVKVGIFGLGIDFEGLVLDELHEGVGFQDPVGVARETVQQLRREGCALVVCLSHLGYQYREEDRIDDLTLAAQVPGLDVVLGGHTHTFLDEPTVVQHEGARPTLVHQVGWAGIRLGRIDVTFGAGGEVAEVHGGSLLVA